MTDSSNTTGGSMTTAAPSLLTSIGVWLRDVKYKIEMFLVSLFYKVYSFVTYPIVMLVNALGGGERSLSSVGSPEEMSQHASTLAERLNLKKQFQQLERMVEELKA